MRSLGKSIVFIHHAGKNGKQRGTSRREDVLDTVIALQEAESADLNQGAAFKVTFEKTRGFYGESTNDFFAQLCVNPNGKQEWVKGQLEVSKRAKVEELCKKGLSQKDVVIETGFDKSLVSRYWIRKMKAV